MLRATHESNRHQTRSVARACELLLYVAVGPEAHMRVDFTEALHTMVTMSPRSCRHHPG